MSAAAGPVAPGARHDGLDVLRGIAVLMIFAVNAKAMFAPLAFYENPTLWPGSHDRLLAKLLTVAVDGKWMPIFALLFGAGLALLWDKALTTGGDPRARILRRLGWLFVFGLIHLFAIWAGDILAAYAVTGWAALPFLRKPSVAVSRWAAGLFVLGLLWTAGLNALLAALPAEALAELSETVWRPDPQSLRADLAAFRSASPLDHAAARFPLALGNLSGLILAGVLPMILSYMLGGIVLFRSGFLLGAQTARLYLLAGVVCVAGAWASALWRIAALEAAQWGFGTYLRQEWIGYLEGPLGALGYTSLILGALRLGAKPTALAAAGRMAFTNYIACSLIGTTLAYGHGGGLYGHLTLSEILIIVGIVWAIILIVSPLWLATFRFGPLEWIWRRLVYGGPIPFCRRSGPARG